MELNGVGWIELGIPVVGIKRAHTWEYQLVVFVIIRITTR